MVSTDRVKRLKREKRQAVIYQYQKDCRYFARIADSLKDAVADYFKEKTDQGHGLDGRLVKYEIY